MKEKIEHNFKYHAPDNDVAILHIQEEVRQLCRTLALFLNDSIPQSRELSLAITKLEEVMMWSNAAIARHQ